MNVIRFVVFLNQFSFLKMKLIDNQMYPIPTPSLISFFDILVAIFILWWLWFYTYTIFVKWLFEWIFRQLNNIDFFWIVFSLFLVAHIFWSWNTTIFYFPGNFFIKTTLRVRGMYNYLNSPHVHSKNITCKKWNWPNNMLLI